MAKGDFQRAARQACREMLKAMPDNWLAVLTNALLLAELETFEKGERLMVDWSNRTASFERYLDLAYFYLRLDQPHKAADTISKATSFAVSPGDSHGGDAEFRICDVAVRAYQSGEYDAAIKLCDYRWSVNESDLRHQLQSLKQAAVDAKKGLPRSATAADKTVFEPFPSKLFSRSLATPSVKQ